MNRKIETSCGDRQKRINRRRMIRECIYFVVHYAFIVSVESNGGRKPVTSGVGCT